MPSFIAFVVMSYWLVPLKGFITQIMGNSRHSRYSVLVLANLRRLLLQVLPKRAKDCIILRMTVSLNTVDNLTYSDLFYDWGISNIL